MTDATKPAQKTQLRFIMETKVKIWQQIYDTYDNFTKSPVMIETFGHCDEFHKMQRELDVMRESIAYVTEHIGIYSESFHWPSFVIVDNHLKNCVNLLNIWFVNLKLLENN